MRRRSSAYVALFAVWSHNHLQRHLPHPETLSSIVLRWRYSLSAHESVWFTGYSRHNRGAAMKKFLLGSVALAAMFAWPAMAADMPVAPPPPPVVYYDWTGAYIGFNAGGVWSDIERRFPNPLTGTDLRSPPALAKASTASTLERSGNGVHGFWAPKRL